MPQPHVAGPNGAFGHDPSPADRMVEGTPVYLASPILPGDDGVDLVDTALILVRGWKIILGLMLVAGVLGAACVSWKPNEYRASTVLRAQLPRQSEAPAATPATGNGVDPVLLQRYAGVFLTEDNLQRAVEDAGLAGPDGPVCCLDEMKAAVAVQVLKDSPDIEVSATLDSPAEAEGLVRALVQRGLASVETARRQDADAVVQQLRKEKDDALEVVREKKKLHRNLRSEKQLDEKRARLQVLPEQLAVIQQAVNTLTLRGAQGLAEQNRTEAQSILQEMATLQSELSDAEADLAFSQRDLEAVQKAHYAAEDSLRRWNKQIHRQFPALAPAVPPQTSLRQIARNRFSQLLLIQFGAFVLGSVVVLLRSAYHKRAASKPPAAGEVLPRRAVRVCETDQQERMSA